MVRSTVDRAFLPAKSLFEQVGDMTILTARTLVSAVRPPYPYGEEFIGQFLDLWGSVLKCTLFGAIIAVVCSYKGMTAFGGAAGVGRAVNEAVVVAFMGVFAFNYAFTQTLLATNPELQTIR